MTSALHRFVLVVVVLGTLATTAFAQQTGTLSGVVRDAQGAVLPGVTVTASSAALIGARGRVQPVTAGAYLLTGLPPGTYTVTYELGGFTPLKRENVVILVVARRRGSTSSSASGPSRKPSPSAARRRLSTSARPSRRPTSRRTSTTPFPPDAIRGSWPGSCPAWSPVASTSAAPKGCSSTTSRRSARPTARSRFRIDGLKTNWGGGSGGATMQYDGFEMYDEYNMQTASGTAESDVSGVYMNMVTKSGGNRFTSDHNFYFMNDALQGDEHRRRAAGGGSACQPGQTRPARPATRLTFRTTGARRSAGPIKRDTRLVLRRAAPVAARSVPDRSAQSGRLAGASTTTASRTSWAR